MVFTPIEDSDLFRLFFFKELKEILKKVSALQLLSESLLRK